MQSLPKFRVPPHNKTVGIEIECFTASCVAVEKYKHYGFFYATDDGSINPRSYAMSGVEFVSQPLPVDMLCKQLDKLGKKFHWEHNSSCGIHVHVSRKWLSEKKAKAIYNWIKTLSYADMALLFGRVANTYCRNDVTFGSTRYCAVNIMNTHTIEFRMFSSGNVAWAKWCVKLVEYMIVNAYHLNIDAAMAFRDMYFGGQ